MMANFYKFVCAFYLPCQIFASTFNNQITLAQFGIAVNNNTSLQTASRYPSDPVGQVLRTNDFQTFQLSFGDYATDREPCRMGLFNISESENAVGRVPFGTKVDLAGFSLAGLQDADIEPNRYMELVSDPSFITFSFTETLAELNTDLQMSDTYQVCEMRYQAASGDDMTSYHVHGNPFHDVEYESLTPYLVFGDGLLITLEVDGNDVTLPTAGTNLTLPAGQKFKFILDNPEGEPPGQQVWLVYAQTTDNSSITFDMTFELNPDEKIHRFDLTSQDPYSGFLRTIALQPSRPIARKNLVAPRTTPKWQLATQLQSLPATPLAMFHLWPYDWTKEVGKQILFNEDSRTFLASYESASLLLPLLARSDLNQAIGWFNQLIDRENRGSDSFDIGTNPFVSLINMYIASKYDGDISSFQGGIPRGFSTSALSFTGDVSSMESEFDSYRSMIPTSVELVLNEDGTYSYLYNTLDIVTTFPTGGATVPLLAFPGYKVTDDGFIPLGNTVNKDPIKGDILYVPAAVSEVPGDFFVTFKATAPPSWAGRFMPDDFWNRINGSEKTNIILQLNEALFRILPGANASVYDQGKFLFQIAMTLKYATYVLLAESGHLPPYDETIVIPSSIITRLQPLLTYIEDMLESWLVSQSFDGEALTNFFVADDDAKGIVASLGTASATGGELDSGNAVYTGHNRQYGYFLAAAAIAIETDLLFGNSTWIGSTITKTSTGHTGEVKQFVDALWRDYANPVTDDPENMPFDRFGNVWEGMSCEKGVPPSGTFPSRSNESISEDFNGFYGSWLYSRAIQNSPDTDIPEVDKEGFEVLEVFSLSKMSMIARAGKGLFYRQPSWVYAPTPFGFNYTSGTQWDNKVDSDVTPTLTAPPCIFTEEGELYSNYRFDVFIENLVETFQNQ